MVLPISRLALAVVLCLLSLACGRPSGPRESEPLPPQSTQQSQFPLPNESVDRAAQRIRSASSDCAKLAPLIHSYLRPKDQVRADDQCKGFLPLLNGFREVRFEQYGSAAVIDYTFDKEGFRPRYAMLLALDEKRILRFFAVEGEHPTGTVGTVPPDVIAFDRAATDAVNAIRAGHCDQLHALAHQSLAPAASDKVEFCRQYLGSGFQKALQAMPTALPIRMGANAFYGFYALRVTVDRFYTVVIAQDRGTPKFVSELRAPGA